MLLLVLKIEMKKIFTIQNYETSRMYDF
jgi:hypothetical protein